jgi:hypothetical protein
MLEMAEMDRRWTRRRGAGAGVHDVDEEEKVHARVRMQTFFFLRAPDRALWVAL